MKKTLLILVVVTMLITLLSTGTLAAEEVYDGYLEISQNAADENITQGPNWYAQARHDYSDIDEDGTPDWVNLPYVDWETHFTHWSGGTSPQVGNGGEQLAINAGDEWGAPNAQGAVAFVAPKAGDLTLYANTDFPNIALQYATDPEVTVPVKVKIMHNDTVVWPTSGEWFELSSSVPAVAFPEIELTVAAGDVIRIVAEGNTANTWKNHVTFYPLVSYAAAPTSTPTQEVSNDTSTNPDDDETSPGDPFTASLAIISLATLSSIVIFRKK